MATWTFEKSCMIVRSYSEVRIVSCFGMQPLCSVMCGDYHEMAAAQAKNVDLHAHMVTV